MYTITSCAPTVKDCPAKLGAVTTEVVSIGTTVCPVTETQPKASSPTVSVAPSLSPNASSSISSGVSSASSVLSSAASYDSSKLNSVISSLDSTVSSALPSLSSLANSSLVSKTTSTILASSIQAMPTTYSVSSEVTTSTLSTVYSTNVYTITSCAPAVTDCPAKKGSVTTELVSLYTTICPITKTVLDGVTYTPQVSPVNAAQTFPSSVVSTSQGPPDSLTSATMPVATTVSITSSNTPQDITNFTNSSGLYSLTLANSTMPSLTITAPIGLTTSTVYSTNIYTVTSCAPDVKDCPGRGEVTTEIIAVSTTICPVTENTASTINAVDTTSLPASLPKATASAEVVISTYVSLNSSRSTTGSTSAIASSISSSSTPFAAQSSAPLSPSPVSSSSIVVPVSSGVAAESNGTPTELPVSRMSTVYSTNVYTITSCAPEVKNCPASPGTPAVTTEIIAVSTTICPITYSTAAVTLSNTVGSSTNLITTTITYEDAPAPTSPVPQSTGAATAAGSSSPEASPTKPCTTLTLGNYFTTIIEYEALTSTPPVLPANVAPPAAEVQPTSSSYKYNAASGTQPALTQTIKSSSSATVVEASSSSSSPPNAVSPNTPAATAAVTRLTSTITNTQTVTSIKPSGVPLCEPVTSYVTVTVTVAADPVTVTAQPPYPPGYYGTSSSMYGTAGMGFVGGTGSLGVGTAATPVTAEANGANIASSYMTVPYRRWFNGHGHMHGLGRRHHRR
ncbi:hypothetical protein TruAng_010709 [Truncatella angustata]|nr:hypothetical protein TruAng_010709 [Truncatella angustata]